MFARKSVLDSDGIRVPTIDQPWTADEFDAALQKIKAGGQVPEPARHGDRRHRRVVALRLLAVPAELRRRPDRPRRLQDAPTACSTAPRPIEWATWFQGLVTDGLHRRRSPAPTPRRTSSTASPRSSGRAPGAPANLPRLRRATASSCRRRTSAPARRSAAARGSGASAPSCANPAGALDYMKFSAAGQVRRAGRRASRTHPGDRRGGRAWSRATSRAGAKRIFLDDVEEVRRDPAADTRLPVHRDHVHQGRAGHRQRRVTPSRPWTRPPRTSTPTRSPTTTSS